MSIRGGICAGQCHAHCPFQLLPHDPATGPEEQMAVQVNVTLIVLFNYYYTFLQLDPKDMADQLKRAGGAIPAVRPGRATADYITKTLNRMSILGSAFLGALAAAPPLVEAVTGLQVKLPAIFVVSCTSARCVMLSAVCGLSPASHGMGVQRFAQWTTCTV